MKARLNLACGGAAAAVIFLAISFPAAEYQLQPLQVQTNKEVVLNLSTATNGLYDLQASTNAVRWQGLATALSTTNWITHTDSAAPFLNFRIYRGRVSDDVLTGDRLPTAEGDVIIHPGNHAGLVLKWTNVTIYVDPDVNVFAGLPLADLILITHDHGDHYEVTTINAIKSPTALILAPQAVYNLSAFSTLRSITRVLTNNMGTNLLGLRIDAVPAYNYPPGNMNHGTNVGNGYVLTIGGKKIYISGDTEDIPEMRNLANIDVAFLAMNQPYTMTAAQAVNAVRMFVPKVVYPYHHSGTPAADLSSFKQQCMTNPAVEVRLRKWY